MAYDLQAAVARAPVLDQVARQAPGAPIVDLPGGLALLVADAAWLGDPGARSLPWLDFERLTDAGARRLELASAAGPVVYLEIEEQSDLTWQGAAGWSDGRRSFGPRLLRPGEARPEDGGPVVAAFAFLGAAADPRGSDLPDFGLYRFRHTGEWRAAARR